jgi:uncharacterized membrane protein YccC
VPTRALPLLIVIGRPGDVIAAGITTTVVLIAAAVSPHDAWEQPILRLVDTALGIAIGVGAAWLTLELPAMTNHVRGARHRFSPRADAP